jgi:uncharacterized protein (TIGR02246 family)
MFFYLCIVSHRQIGLAFFYMVLRKTIMTIDAVAPDAVGSAQILYRRLIDAWNNQNAAEFANAFAQEATCIGFDGSQLIGRDQIRSSLTEIFRDHPTASYYTLIREVKEVSSGVMLLRANVGMVLPGKTDIDPAKNAIQCMVACFRDDQWKIVLFQNTPAQFHGRPELTERLNEELRELLKKHS